MMRFAHAHKLTTYLMVLSAYFALVLSGELADAAVLLSFFGLVGSWFWEPPRIRYETFAIPWTVVSILVLGYTLLSAFSGGDVLLIGGEFLLYLLIAKLYNRRTCKDYLHIYVITFLMLVAGTVLNSEFTYGIFFLGYVVSATWAFILFHLRREMEDNFLLKHSDDRPSERVQVDRILNSRRIVGRRFFTGTAMVSLTIFAVASLLFLAIPRIGFGLFFQKNRGGITMAGFSDGVSLGGHGVIKTDSTVVMRVEIEDEYEGRKAPYIHWRGVAFDEYKKGTWMRSRHAPKTARRVTYPRPGVEQYHVLYHERHRSIGELHRRAEKGVRQAIYLEPIGYDVLFGASMPRAFEFDSKFGMRSPRTERNDEMRFAHSAGIKYVVYSAIDRPDSSVLRAATNASLPPGYRETYLQLPDEITDEVKNLAREITRNAPTAYDKAEAIQTWLKENLSYTLVMKSPGRTEPIHFFLFDRRKGHCEYFSSAMAIMLRAVGVPTRNVNGFLGGEWNEYNDYIAVRAGDAHSWVEVYFDGVGWVTFDPTPSGEIDRLGRGGNGIRDRFRRLLDTLRFKWFKWVIEYDLYRQLSLFRGLRESLRSGAGYVKSVVASIKNWLAKQKLPALIGAGLILALVLFILWRRWRKRYPTMQSATAARTRGPVALLYNRVLTRLHKRGHRRDPAMTPREYAQRLERDGMPGAESFRQLTELYYRAVYGPEADADMAAAKALDDAVEQAFIEAKRAAKRAEKKDTG